jgi:DNA polymerase-3 subunit alpha
MKQYVELHCHDIFSLLDGYSKPEDYIKRAKELNMGAIAQTNHGHIYGWMDFYEQCKEYDLKPIFGIEAYQSRKTRFDKDPEEMSGPARFEWDQRGPYHVTIHAKDKVGYHNLIKLSSRAYTEGYLAGKARVDHELISQHSEGLIVLSGCLGGEVQQALLRDDYDTALNHASKMQEIVGRENYFIELHDHGIEEEARVREGLLRIARTIDAPLVPTGDCHYTYKEDHAFHDGMLCVGTKSLLADENRFRFAGPEFYLKSYDEMVQKFDPEWVRNTNVIADMVDVNLDFGEYYFPDSKKVIPEGADVNEHLELMAWAGLKELYGDPLPQNVIKRAEYELGVIKRMGFQDYYLVVADIVNWAKDNKIPTGPGRGSAAGSIISYALKITGIDPLKYGLLFERFLIEGRQSVPDIDLDFDDRFRHLVIEYCVEKYGADRVAHISTFARTKAASCLRDATRVLGYEYSDGDRLVKLMPDAVLGVTKTLPECMQLSSFRAEYDSNSLSKEIIDLAIGLEGKIRQTGIHAAGIVITRGPVMDYVPVLQKGEDEPLVTQWDGEWIEKNGLLKIDFLGLRNLGVIDSCIERIKKRHDISLDINKIPLDSVEVYESLQIGSSVGLFQIESGGMKEMMMDLKPENINDIMALISLYRPGPMGSGVDKMYINRKRGREKVNYVHESLVDILEDSKGIMLYQEDVLNVAKVVAGFTSAEADDLRKIMGKKIMDKVAEYRDMFVQGAIKTSGMSASMANKLYSDIEFFAGYGFNMAHAISYALISYQTAYLKVHYPIEYMASLLDSVVSKKEKLGMYLNECKNLDINVISPSVIESEYQFQIKDDNTILFGLSAIDGIGEIQAQHVLNSSNTGASNIFEFFRWADDRALNTKVIENLIKAGAFDSLVPDELLADKIDKDKKINILKDEYETIGIYISGHPLDDIWDVVSQQGADTVESIIKSSSAGQTVELYGVIFDYKALTTKRGPKMCRFRFEDKTGSVDAIAFPREFASIIKKIDLHNGLLCKIKADIKIDSSSLMLLAKDIQAIPRNIIESETPIMLQSNTAVTQEQLNHLNDIIINNKGAHPVYLTMQDDGLDVSIRFKTTVKKELEHTLKDVLTLQKVSLTI